MRTDPVVEAARKPGIDYIQSFGGDLKAVVADLQRRTEAARQAGQIVVSSPPRRLPPRKKNV